jgi:glycosyltransferase involved in cell wall biosynthesis
MRLDAKFWKTKVLYRIDECASVLLNLLLVCAAGAVGAAGRAWRLLCRGRRIEPGAVLFLSCEGHKVAPTRARCYHFAEVLRRQGMDAEVFAYWDEFSGLAHFPFPFRRIWEVEKFWYNLAALVKLLPRGPLVILEQRPNYDFIVPLCLKLINGSRVVMDIDDWTLSYRAFCIPARLEVRHMLPFFALMSDTCIVSSRRLRERLGRHFRDLPLLPTYVDHVRFTPGLSEPGTLPAVPGCPVVFSWVGTIFQDFTRDNVMFMVEAFARACDILGTREGLALDIVGGGDYFRWVEERVGRQFAGYPVRVKPWMAPKAMPDYLRSIDVGLYCLLDPSAFHESKSPTKIFEYYACGKPVVSTSLGEAKYFVKDGGTGYLADGVEAYAKAISHLFLSPDDRRDMGREGRRLVERKWNMEAACQRLQSILLRESPGLADGNVAGRGQASGHKHSPPLTAAKEN